MSIKLDIQQFLKDIDKSGNDILASDAIEKLEGYVHASNASANAEADGGDILVDDTIYERLVELLETNKPDSPLLHTLWTEDEVEDYELDLDINRYIKDVPMCSINTIKHLNFIELREFINALPYGDGEPFDLFYAYKLNGHGVRVVYKYGDIANGTSRGRSTAGKNLTRHFKVICGEHNEGLEEMPLCEIRGEFVLPYENLDTAREYNPNIKTAFTGVSSMIRQSASDGEIQLIEFVAYRFIADGVSFETKEDEYAFLESLGFTTPLSWLQEGVTKETIVDCIDSLLSDIEADVNSYEYFTDGVVCQINSNGVFYDIGKDTNGKYYLGNVALKVRHWKQDSYSGIIHHIEWTEGKGKYSPVAIVVDEECGENEYNKHRVPTASGNSVSRVPLYEPANILLLEAYPNNVLFFRYGGESGVVPCFPNGMLLTDSAVKKMIEDDVEPEKDADGYYF